MQWATQSLMERTLWLTEWLMERTLLAKLLVSEGGEEGEEEDFSS